MPGSIIVQLHSAVTGPAADEEEVVPLNARPAAAPHPTAAGRVTSTVLYLDRGLAMDTFYLGTHQPHWLNRPGFPLFISHRQLARRRSMPPAACRWALDSGGFTELSMNGRWITTPEEYVTAAASYAEGIGALDFAAPQDWMCEPFMIERTGLSVAEHQHRTVDELPDAAPSRARAGIHASSARVAACRITSPASDLYASAGVDLAALPRVGLGSVCRRQSTERDSGDCRCTALLAASGCTGSASRPAACTCMVTCWPRPTRWPGVTPHAANHPCPGAADTRTAPTAWCTPPAGVTASSPGTPRSAARTAFSTLI